MYKWYLEKKVRLWQKLGFRIFITDFVTLNALTELSNGKEYTMYKHIEHNSNSSDVNLEVLLLTWLNKVEYVPIQGESLDLTYEMICDKLTLVASILPKIKVSTTCGEETFIRLYK